MIVRNHATNRVGGGATALPFCFRAHALMLPSPRAVVSVFRDLGLSDEEIGRYFSIPAQCITAIGPPRPVQGHGCG